MWSAILTGSLWTFALSLVFLLSPLLTSVFRVDAANKYVLTGYFGLFVFTAVFNAFNARTEQVNIFDHFWSNRGFIRVIGLIVVVQLTLLYLGGAVLGGYGLTAPELAVVLALAFLIIPVDTVRKLLLRRSQDSGDGSYCPAQVVADGGVDSHTV